MIVMIVCHFDDSNPLGGLERQTHLLARKLRQEGRDVVVLSSTRKLARAKWQRDGGVPVRLFWTYASPQVSGRYLPAALIWAAQLLIWIALNRARIGLIHCHQIRIHAFVAALSRRLFKIPVIAKSALGGSGADLKVIGSRKYFGPLGRRFLLRHIDCFVATTRSIETDLLSWRVPSERIRLIPNGVELCRSPVSMSAERRSRRCVFLGRIDLDKNVLALAQAALAAMHGNYLTLDFFGVGPDLSKLEALLKNTARVRALGWVPNPMEHLASYGYLLLPSQAEGLSNAMIEAMAAGVVPVTSRVSGCIDHLQHGVNGLFFSGTSVEALATGISGLAAIDAEAWQALSASARSYALASFDIEAVARSYCRLYRELAVEGSFAA